MKIFVPQQHFIAVSYTLNCLFKEFLGVNVEVIPSDDQYDFLLTAGEREVIIANVFFSSANREELYHRDNIPDSVDDASVEFGNKNFPLLSIYGKSALEFSGENRVEVKSDLIGNTFFMLSRWEEAVIADRDAHGRFDYRSSLAVKKGFYQRPVVNEYVEFLWELCLFLKPSLRRKERNYTCTVTSDIDQLRRWKRPKLLGESLYLHLTAGKINRIGVDVVNYLTSRRNSRKDHYNNLHYLVEKTHPFQTVFYLKTGYSHPKHDKNRYVLEDYSMELERAMENGVEFGIHPHYDTFDDSEKLKADQEKLALFLKKPVTRVRQHYLRFSVPETWVHQESCGLKEDSTMIFPHLGGFRNGVCYPFPVFDFKKNRQPDLYESPLILMETAYLNSGFNQLLSDSERLIAEVKKYGGNFVLLWHNGNLVYSDDRKYFEKLLELAKPD